MDINNILEIIKNIDLSAYHSNSFISPIISWLIGSIITVTFLAFTFREVRKKFSDREVKFGTAHLILGWACLAFSSLGVWELFHKGHDTYDINTFYSISAFSIGFAIGSLYIFIEHIKIHGVYNSEGIVFSSPWTGIKKESWCDLISIKRGLYANWYVLKFKSGTTIRLSYFLVGHGVIIELLERLGHKP